MTYENLKARLENIQWRADEGLKTLDDLIKAIDNDDDDEVDLALIDLKNAWLGGIKYTVGTLLADLEETKES